MMRTIFKFFSVIIIALYLSSCNKKPDLPTCIYPPDGATNINDSILVLSWECKDPDGDKLVYDVYLSEEKKSFDSNTKVAEFYDGTTYEIKNLKDNTTYYWEVVAIDPIGKFSLNSWQFTTGKIER